MARKSKTSSPVKTPAVANIPYFSDTNSEWAGFINIRLSDDQKLEFGEWWTKNAAHVNDALEELLSQGMKLTTSFDFEHDCYIVSFTGNLLLEVPASRCSATSRAPSLAEAYALSVFKHYVVSKGNYGNFRPKTGTFMTWG